MSPQRHQRKRTKGYRLPDGVVCVTRPGKWGNPFSDSHTFRLYLQLALLDGFNPKIKYNPAFERIRWIADNLEQLRGKDLACFCKVGESCHADVLIEFANR